MTQVEPSADDYPLVGQTIANKYKIVRLLGEGGMGCVYLGEQKLGTTARKVAVKTLHKHLSHDKSIKDRFEREVSTVVQLEHPNTIQVFDYGSMDDGTLYIVMEYVSGRSVADILEKDGAMPPARVEHILRQVVGSLEEAHNHGIVHRDLKPDNVVLSERAGQKDWVEVLDFGIAKRSSEQDPNEAKLTQQGMVLGTPPYMSPEQFTGQPVDLRSDVYALGVMAYEMLSGKLPWEANTAWEWASKHMTEAPTPLERQPLGPNVPAAMRFAIARALEKDKNARFGSVREFFEAFSGGAAPASMAAPGAGAGTAAFGPGPNSAAGAMSQAPVSRVRTEMGAPMMAGPVSGPVPSSGAYTPPPAPAMVPAPPQAEAKKGGSGLVIGLGVLAVVFIGGSGLAYWLSNRSNPVPVAPIDLGTASASAIASAVTPAGDPNAAVSAAPALDPAGQKNTAHVPPHETTSGGSPHTTPTKPVPTPVPTPTPVKPADPPICQRARDSRGKVPPKILASLEDQCRKAGGTP
jgi:serine/threonine-protein kinase